MIAKLICRLFGHKRRKRIPEGLRCPRCMAVKANKA